MVCIILHIGCIAANFSLLGFIRACAQNEWISGTVSGLDEPIYKGTREIILLSVVGFCSLVIQVAIRLRSVGWKIHPTTITTCIFSFFKSIKYLMQQLYYW
jgi:hypothetical protein